LPGRQEFVELGMKIVELRRQVGGQTIENLGEAGDVGAHGSDVANRPEGQPDLVRRISGQAREVRIALAPGYRLDLAPESLLLPRPAEQAL
jgi:hypothetical protein